MSEAGRTQGNQIWGEDWPEVCSQWLLDPTVTYLNHGSFGASPRPVLHRQAALRNEMEEQPVEFLDRRLKELAAATRRRLGDFLGANPNDLVFVPNATAAVATVLASLSLGPGDQIVLTDHSYPAILNTARRTCDRTGAELVVRQVPLPLPAPESITDGVTQGLTDRTRLAIIDHVTSPTAAIFPIVDIVSECRLRGVQIMVDAAHGPGMLPMNLATLNADYWTGNFHKWVCAPKGSAALFVQPEHQSAVRPLATSHGYGRTFQDEFDWTGTHDPTPYLCVPGALDFFEALGWDRVWAHNHALAAYGQRVVSEAVRTAPPVPEAAFGSMSLVGLPEGVATTQEEAVALQARLYAAARIEVPFVSWNGRGYVRLSAQIYNCPSDYECLAEALPGLL